MNGKTVLITGASHGIGKATAVALARLGARVILAARSAPTAEIAAFEVRRESGSSQVAWLAADLSSQDAVRQLARDFKARYDRLDVLVNNAGVLVPQRRTTVDGVEETFAVNHLAPFLLTSELLDVLRHSAPARVVNVSSEAHRAAHMNWGDLELESTGYRAFAAYGQSKLANLLFTYELARRLAGTGVTCNALHPGLIASGLGLRYGGPTAFALRIARPFLRSPEAGARAITLLAMAPELATTTGAYFVRDRAVASSPCSLDRAGQCKLWALSKARTSPRARAA
jgi:NAD(P)-dependent dehydrogenase (short-subunit alcohol dehydrogenase family)